MQELIHGIHDFQSGSFRILRDLFEELAHGQAPETLFITCSDSRIDPNLLTRSRPGDLFILRNAGNIIPPHGAENSGEAATIEFAVAGLGVKSIIVCGHSHCGAMKALIDEQELARFPAMAAWLKHAAKTRRILHENYAGLPVEQLYSAAIEENVLVQLENLRTLPDVAARLAEGNLELHGWVYEIETGSVFEYDQAAGQFVSVAEHKFPETDAPARLRTTTSI